MQWTITEVAGALGVAPPQGLDPVARLADVSIDSRSIRPGELFVAIHGPRHDGHAFVAAALAAGAPAAVVAADQIDQYPDGIRGKLLPVAATLPALQRLAQAIRRSWGTPRAGRRMVAITGSAGKTTTKEILAALLSARMGVLKSEGNLNNEYGVPLTLCRLDARSEAAVIELGMSHRGELAQLAKIAEPEMGVVTNVGAVHLEYFASVDEIALAKRELIEGLAGPEPVAVLNADDARVARFAEGFRGRVVWFGGGPSAEFRAERIENLAEKGSAFDFVAPAGRARLELPLLGSHNVWNALAALAAASLWGIGAAEARRVFPQLVPCGHRGNLLRFAEGFTVLDDCYNSNPAALAAMVNWLAAASGYRRRVLVAGEMLELGPASGDLHREAGRRAAAWGKLDWIIGVQGSSAELVRGAMEAGHPQAKAQFFPSAPEAAEFLVGFVAPGDLLLVKGSRGVRMERIVEALAARYRFAEAAEARAVPPGGRRG